MALSYVADVAAKGSQSPQRLAVSSVWQETKGGRWIMIATVKLRKPAPAS